MRTLTALFVDDEDTLREQYMENLTIALRDACEIEVIWDSASRIEEAKKALPRGQSRYELVVVDLLWRAIGLGKGGRDARGLEVVAQAAKTPSVVIVALSVGDTTNFPELREDALSAGAHVFRLRGALQAASRSGGWDRLAVDIREALETARRGGETEAPKGVKKSGREVDRKSLFVVCGRNVTVNTALYSLLRALGLFPYEWEQLVALAVEAHHGGGNPNVLEVVEYGFEIAHGALVLFTPDDQACLADIHRVESDAPYERVLTGQPRPNVLLEAGYALGQDRQHTLVVSVGEIRPISDLSGLHILRLDDSAARRKDLAERLRAMGFDVETRGEHWLSAGSFGV
jgi:predicted nucleotide-binding protein